MSRIRILAENVANKIAAGEVVERPASVVKELLENALDAGARSIRIETESGGKRMIRVIDDGTGMNHDDALLAFERHATSKLRTADDLLSISTLGFRGEALPSIASISRLLLETRSAEDEQGTRVEFAGGKLISVKPAGLPAGTSISVADIFYCVPARRKFLKSETTELGHIASLVTHYALAHPDCQFLLKTPTQEILNCTPVEKLSERVYQIFGRQALDELTEITPTEGPVRSAITEPPLEAEERAATLRVSGFTSRPEVQRTNRNGIYIFVNRRLVRDRLLLHAIGEAYRNIMPPAFAIRNSFTISLATRYGWRSRMRGRFRGSRLHAQRLRQVNGAAAVHRPRRPWEACKVTRLCRTRRHFPGRRERRFRLRSALRAEWARHLSFPERLTDR